MLQYINVEFMLQYTGASLCNQHLSEFSSNQFETLGKCYFYIEYVHMTFCRQKNFFWTKYMYGFFGLDSCEVRLEHRVASLCYQLLPQFLSNQFETLHRYYQPIEDMHMTF